MASPYFLGGIATITVGGGAAATIGYCCMPSQPTSFSNNYLVSVVKDKGTSIHPLVTCTYAKSCLLADLQTKKSLLKEDFSQIRIGQRYAISLNNESLKANSFVEMAISEDKKLYFEVLSAPSKEQTIPLKPNPPKDLITFDEFINKKKTTKDLSKDLQVIRSLRYLNNLEETYIKKPGVNHEEFLILKWGVHGDVSFLQDKTALYEKHAEFKAINNGSNLTDTQNTELQNFSTPTLVDQYVFKAFEDQEALAKEGLELSVQINDEEHKTPVEIYEIKEQQSIIDAVSDVETKAQTKRQPNWESIAKENTLVTKMTQMENDKYYKFVIKDFSKFEQSLNTQLKGIHIRFDETIQHNTSRSFIFSRDSDSDVNYYCVKFKNPGALTNKCEKFFKNENGRLSVSWGSLRRP